MIKVSIISRHFFCSFCFCFFINLMKKLAWDRWKFLGTVLFFLFYLVFCFFFIGLQRKPARGSRKFLVTFFLFFFIFLHWSSEETGKRQSKISRHFFLFFFLPLLYLYYAQDSSKKVTRNIKQARSDFCRWYMFQKFLVTFFLFFLFFSS